LFSTVIPSKIFESMGMGLPIVLSLPEGEAAQLIRDSGAGLVVQPENPQVLADAILRLFENETLRADLANASANAASSYSRQSQADKMLACLQGLKRK